MSLLQLTALLSSALGVVHGLTTVTVQSGTTFQTMDGFGFSEAFGHAQQIMGYPAAEAKATLDLLFDRNIGAGLTIVRNRIGSGGAGDGILPTSPGCPTCAPTYVWDGVDAGQVWFAQQAMTYGVKTFYADAWSAPGFMKTNNNEANGGSLCGVTGATCASGDWKQAYANLIAQYILFYKQSNVTLTHVGFLNEPEFQATYSSMLSNGQQAADFIKVLAPTLTAAGLTTKIACCDSEGWKNQITMTNDINAAGAMPLLGIVTSHAYTSSPSTPLNTTHPVWQTENADLNDQFNPNNWYSSGGAGEGMTWANRISDGIVNSNLSAYLYWVGNEPGGTTDSTLTTTNGTTVIASKRLWAFAQWSRYVRPGAVRLGTSAAGTTTNFKFSAFKNPDSSVSVQILNNGQGNTAVNVTTAGFVPTKAFAVVSAQGIDLDTVPVTLVGGLATVIVPANGMVTVVFNAGSTEVPPSSSTTFTTSASSGTGCFSPIFGQCGGQSWTGCTSCAAGSTCVSSNPFYSQCVQN
ncbi:unnamed protein product [Mycena citricolor]|uniref:CBM1 domain-containing protein n=1 Tax=Mycena citricolor TaxID=2018698 RepID=A0AAD2I065_9AGAR|nr:unnamed protein product [Mycena citricolor]CAK5284826.1 unnamed protein product [Mycena citricolor]